MDIKKTLGKLPLFIIGVLLSLFLFLPFGYSEDVPPEQQSSDLILTGLSFEDVNESWHSDGVNFRTSYLDINLTAKQVFVPDVLSGATEHFTYALQEWHGDQARIWITLTYYEHGTGFFDYTDVNLRALLGNRETAGVDLSGAEEFEVWDETNAVLYNVGDVVIYNSEYYLCKQQIFNYNGLPPALPQYWELTEESEGSLYPATLFQISNKEVYASSQTDTGYVFNVTDFLYQGDGYNVSWKIRVSSHYHHIIIDYELWFENSTNQSSLVHTWQDVYSGERPEFLPVTGHINKYVPSGASDYKDRFTLWLDNLYSESYTANVTIAYPGDKELWKVDFGDYVEIENRYSHVVSKATELGKTDTLLDNTDGYIFKTYSVTVPADTILPLSYSISTGVKESNNLRMWIEGSFAGGSGYTEILITNAEHLDSDREFIADIYDTVKAQDDVWSPPIYHNEYVRVRFEKNLSTGNDITVYVRNNQSLNTLIEVYHFNSSEKITEFPVITSEGYYKEYLTLDGEHDTFDLRIKNLDDNSGAYLEFDYITDPVDLLNGLVSYWKFDENTGSSAFDEMNVRNGTITDATWTTGKINSALDFGAGTDNYKVTLPSNPLSANFRTAQFSFSAWVYNPTSIIYGDGLSSSSSVFAGILMTADKLAVLVQGGSASNTAWGWISTNEVFTQSDVWYHIVYTSTTNGAERKMYINGSEVPSQNWASYTGSPTTTFDTHTFGMAVRSSGPVWPIEGLIDEPAFWNRTLSADEVAALYAGGVGLQYPFNALQDLSGIVKLPDDSVVANATVIIIDQADNTIWGTTTSNATGGWNVAGVNQSTYLVVAYDPNNVSRGGAVHPHIFMNVTG